MSKLRRVEEILRDGFPEPLLSDYGEPAEGEGILTFYARVMSSADYRQRDTVFRAMSDPDAAAEVRHHVSLRLVEEIPIPEPYTEWLLFQLHSRPLHTPHKPHHRPPSKTTAALKIEFIERWRDTRQNYPKDYPALAGIAEAMGIEYSRVKNWFERELRDVLRSGGSELALSFLRKST